MLHTDALTSKAELSSTKEISFFKVFDEVDCQPGRIMEYEDFPLSQFLLNPIDLEEFDIMENLAECSDLLNDMPYFSSGCTMMSDDTTFDLIDYPNTPSPSPTSPTMSFPFHITADQTPSGVVDSLPSQPPAPHVKQERQHSVLEQSWYEHRRLPATGEYQSTLGDQPMTSFESESPQKPTNNSEVDNTPSIYDQPYSSTHHLVSPHGQLPSFNQLHHTSSLSIRNKRSTSYPPLYTINDKTPSTTNIPISSPATPLPSPITSDKSPITQLPSFPTLFRSPDTPHASPDIADTSPNTPNKSPITPPSPLTTVFQSPNTPRPPPNIPHISPDTKRNKRHKSRHSSLFIHLQPPDTLILSPNVPLPSPNTPVPSPVTPLLSPVTDGKSCDHNMSYVHFIDVKKCYEKTQVRRGGVSEQRLVNCRVHMMAVFVNPLKNIRVFVDRYPENAVFEKYTEIPITKEIMLPNTQYFSSNLDAVYLTRFGNKFYKLSTTDRQRKNRFRLRVALTFDDTSTVEYLSDPFLIRSRKQSPNPRKKRGKKI